MTKQQTQFSTIVKQYVRRVNKLRFTRQDILRDPEFMENVLSITESKTPGEQVSFLLQKLRDNGSLTFVDYDGTYEVVTSL